MDTGDWEGTYIDVEEDHEIPDKSKIRVIISAGTSPSAPEPMQEPSTSAVSTISVSFSVLYVAMYTK